MFNLWWESDPSETPYRPQSTKQQSRQYTDTLPKLPYKNTYEKENLGKTKNTKTKSMSYMQKQISANKANNKIMRETNLQARMGKNKCNEALVPRITKKTKNRIDRLRGIGNGQVPAVVAAVWRLLTEES